MVKEIVLKALLYTLSIFLNPFKYHVCSSFINIINFYQYYQLKKGHLSILDPITLFSISLYKLCRSLFEVSRSNQGQGGRVFYSSTVPFFDARIYFRLDQFISQERIIRGSPFMRGRGPASIKTRARILRFLGGRSREEEPLIPSFDPWIIVLCKRFSRCICFAQIYRVNDDNGEKFEGGSSADFCFLFFYLSSRYLAPLALFLLICSIMDESYVNFDGLTF